MESTSVNFIRIQTAKKREIIDIVVGCVNTQRSCLQQVIVVCVTQSLWVINICKTRCRKHQVQCKSYHYDDVIMTMLASQITSLTVVYSIVYSGVNQRKHQSSASLAIVRELHRGPVNFPHKWPVTRKMFPFDDVIMIKLSILIHVLISVKLCS